jgi:hypothetical protein
MDSNWHHIVDSRYMNLAMNKEPENFKEGKFSA